MTEPIVKFPLQAIRVSDGTSSPTTREEPDFEKLVVAFGIACTKDGITGKLLDNEKAHEARAILLRAIASLRESNSTLQRMEQESLQAALAEQERANQTGLKLIDARVEIQDLRSEVERLTRVVEAAQQDRDDAKTLLEAMGWKMKPNHELAAADSPLPRSRNEQNPPTQHVCGGHGFGREWSDTCPACDIAAERRNHKRDESDETR